MIKVRAPDTTGSPELRDDLEDILIEMLSAQIRTSRPPNAQVTALQARETRHSDKSRASSSFGGGRPALPVEVRP